MVSVDNVSQQVEIYTLDYANNSNSSHITYANWSFPIALDVLGIFNVSTLELSKFSENMETSGYFTNVTISKNVTYRIGSYDFRTYLLAFDSPQVNSTYYIDSYSGLIVHSIITQLSSTSGAVWTLNATNIPTTASSGLRGFTGLLYNTILSPLVLIFIGLIAVLGVAAFYFRRSRTKN